MMRRLVWLVSEPRRKPGSLNAVAISEVEVEPIWHHWLGMVGLRWRAGNGFALNPVGWHWRIAAAWAAGAGALAKAMDGAQGDRDAALIEPMGNLPVRPVFASQFNDRLTMRFEFAARAPCGFVLGLGL